jgi:hypothetical protein
MSATEASEIADVVERVAVWPAPMRIALARRILETLEEAAPGSLKTPRGPSAAEVAAMLRTEKPAPSDVTVKEWIDEYRMEKYGK